LPFSIIVQDNYFALPHYYKSSRLTIEAEQQFVDLSEQLKNAVAWELKARLMLEKSASLSEFEDHLRYKSS
jgi:hypothetical protein